jgi:uracil-DNA glycosylase
MSKKQHSLLFTNAILCYRDKGFTGDVKQSWFENCQKFCTRLIDIIQPEAIVTLGYMPLKLCFIGVAYPMTRIFPKPT